MKCYLKLTLTLVGERNHPFYTGINQISKFYHNIVENLLNKLPNCLNTLLIYLIKKRMETIGKRIQKIREIRGYSQDYMAKKLDISQEQYSYLENKQKTIPEKTVELIASVLGVTVEFLNVFDPDNIIHNTFNDSSNGYFNIEKLIIQGHERERHALNELITNLKSENSRLKKELSKSKRR